MWCNCVYDNFSGGKKSSQHKVSLFRYLFVLKYHIKLTSVDIREETGDVLIHFDGWTNKYDYWAKMDSSDLHPIGYMAARAKYHPQLNPRLQEPKGLSSSTVC